MGKANWTIPKMWQNRTVWILGGGPSVTRQFGVPEDIISQIEKGELPVSVISPYMADIHEEPVIGINMAFLIGDWIDMVFFGDPGFYRKPKVAERLSLFPGIKLACHQWYNDGKMRSKDIYAIARTKNKYGISDTPEKVAWNNNSGAAAISVAVHAGAKRIVLLGFDMHSVETHSHWHNEYGKPKKPPYKTHLAGFKEIAKDAEKMGVEIINANPDSAITFFPKMNVKDIIEMKPVPKKLVDLNFERGLGVLNKYKTLQHFHNVLKPDFYLEIGVGRANSLKLSKAEKSYGIDPSPRLRSVIPQKVFKKSSDQFFKEEVLETTIDLAFIDGLHLIENVLKDFLNIEKHCNDKSVVLLDDVAPAHEIQGQRIKQSIKWAGDVWKIVPILEKYRPDLKLRLLDVNPTGMLMVTNLDPTNTVLADNYDKIVKEFKEKTMPNEILLREGVFANLNFLQYEFKGKLKIGVITPTCSPERKPFLDFLKQRMQNQTKQPDEWIIVDYPNESNKIDVAKRYKEGITQAFKKGCDFVLFMEDDDYYPNTYIETMVSGWVTAGMPNIFGVQETLYYHLKLNKFKKFSRTDHCSAFCTGVGRGVDFDICPDHAKLFDIRLWKANNENKATIKLEPGEKPVGIKHGLGLTGGVFHDENSNYPDNGLKLEDYVDEEALSFYKSLNL